ncbi:MAG: OmpA family protein [Clostridium sp.]|nr:OmpA family protein [Clostridium sp.]
MARKKVQRDEPSGDEWLATYSDCVTLLMTFFVLLYAMSSVDEAKMKALSQAFRSVMAGESGDSILEYSLYNGDVPLIGGEIPTDDIDGDKIEESMYQKVNKFLEEHELESVVEIIESERGIVIQLRENILFETAKSSLRNDSKEILSSIAKLISSLDNNIMVEGHTDNRPISTADFPSNWELSVDRAVNVVRYFVETEGINPRRLSATGYGEYQPVANNDTEENMARNRRVNILIMTNDNEE